MLRTLNRTKILPPNRATTIWQAERMVIFTAMAPLEKPMSSQTGLMKRPEQLLTMPIEQNIIKKLEATIYQP